MSTPLTRRFEHLSSKEIESKARKNWREIRRLNDRINLGKASNAATQSALDRRLVDDRRFGTELERRRVAALKRIGPSDANQESR